MKIIKLILIFIFMFSNSCSAFEFQEWHLINENITPLILDANSEDVGKIIYETYESNNSKKTFEIIFTQGKGTGSLYIPDKIKNSKGVMPSDSEYKIFEIKGKKAILENQSYLPLAIAINFNDNAVITIESSSLSEEELIKIAEEILR